MTQRVSDAFACLACAALVAFYAFRQGGYFPDTPGLVGAALLVALALRVVAAERVVAAGRRRLVLAVAALALFGAWTMLSALWSDAPWRAAVESDRVLGYLAVLVLFATLRRGPRSGEWLVRGLALAALVVCGAALATRLAPDAFPTPRDVYPGRLGWPLTYWNALGLLAALGVLACVHVSASARSAALRALAAAALPVLAATLLLTFSRASLALGALAVVAYALLAWSPGAMAALVAAAGPVAVTAVATLRAGALAGDDPAGAAGQAQGHRLAIVVLGAMAAAALARIAVERAPLARLRPPRPRRALIAVAATLAVVAAAGLVAAAARDRGTATADARGHLLSASSSGRHDYWQAALGAFGHRPLDGIGAGTYELWWNAQRPRPTVVVQAHSLPLETLAELGVVGLALLVAALRGVLAAIARRARTRDAAWITLFVAAGVWLLHACIDWDWQMPAVTVWLFAAAGVALAPTAGAAATRRLPAPLRALAGLALVAGAALPSLVALSQVQLRDAGCAGRAPVPAGDRRSATGPLGCRVPCRARRRAGLVRGGGRAHRRGDPPRRPRGAG